MLAVGAHPTRAAESYAACSGFIDAVPASISTQGTWCLRGDRFTSQASGAAISILADNVTIDCSGFRISGLGAGASTNAIGITAGASRLNATIRHCRIQGFKYGVALFGAHDLVERNRFDYSRYVGLYARGEHQVFRDNEVMATGGRPGEVWAYGIWAVGPALRLSRNTVHGVRPSPNEIGNRYPTGIIASGVIEDNHVSGLDVGEAGIAWGLVGQGRSVIRRNSIVQGAPTQGTAIMGGGSLNGLCRGNDAILYKDGIVLCKLAGQNMFLPGEPLGMP